MSGVVVIDLCSLLAGSMAACMLADQGADCIKVRGVAHIHLLCKPIFQRFSINSAPFICRYQTEPVKPEINRVGP